MRRGAPSPVCDSWSTRQRCLCQVRRTEQRYRGRRHGTKRPFSAGTTTISRQQLNCGGDRGAVRTSEGRPMGVGRHDRLGGVAPWRGAGVVGREYTSAVFCFRRRPVMASRMVRSLKQHFRTLSCSFLNAAGMRRTARPSLPKPFRRI